MPGGDERKPAGVVPINSPKEFDFSKPELWTARLKRFERYLSVSQADKKSEKERIDMLCYMMGEKAEEILSQVMPTINATTTYEAVKEKFTSYFAPKKNVVFERYKFNLRSQQLEETVDSFVTSLYTLAETCDFGNLKDELIRDRIVIGIRNARTSERLQLMSDLTMSKALEVARQSEVQAIEGKKIREEMTQYAEVNRIAENRRKQNSIGEKGREQNTCSRCGFAKHATTQKCPASSSRCRKCGNIGHWERTCRTKSGYKVNRVEEEGEEAGDEAAAFLGAVSEGQEDDDFVFTLRVREFTRELTFVVDSGADVTCVSPDDLPRTFRNNIKRSGKIIVGPDGKKLSVLGYVEVHLYNKRKTSRARLYVIENLKRCLLGKPEIKAFDLIKIVNNLSQSNGERVHEFAQRYPKVFEGIGQFDRPLNIQVKRDAIPYFQSVPRAIAVAHNDKLKEELTRLEASGIIVSVDFPTDWCSPIVVIPKKDGEEVRVCGDYTKLNKSVKRANFPVAKVDVALASLQGSKYFTKLDAKKRILSNKTRSR